MPNRQRSFTSSVRDDKCGVIGADRHPDKLIELTKYWMPPVDSWQPLVTEKRSTLRIACVLEDRLYRGLDVECELLLLTPDNWRDVIAYGRPDILFMESIWRSATGHWYMGQFPKASTAHQDLLEIVRMAKSKGIPTVFWMTKGHAYHGQYRSFAAGFDAVFCADPREAELLRNDGIDADLLLPCTQPALFNPFRYFDDYHALSIDFLFDGWADMDRLSAKLSLLAEIQPMGLGIIDSHYRLFRRRAAILDQLKESILGCVNQDGKIVAMKYAKCMITADHSLPSVTTRQWDALDALASRLPILHYGTLADDDMRKHLVVESSDKDRFIESCERVKTDEIYRQTTAQLGWRAVYQHHTFSHRLQTICRSLNIDHGWREYPKASLICPTYRASYVDRLVDTYNRQVYPEKELVVVYNGDGETSTAVKKILYEKHIKCCVVPKDLFAGACLNVGYLNASGDYCFRIDDDDLYGDHYISDMMLYLKAVDGNIFGKPPSGLRFNDDSFAYVRNNPFINCILTRKNLQSRKVWIGGNTIGSKRQAHLQHPYKDKCYGMADTDYQLNSTESFFLLMDNLNVVAERRDDQTTHTWKIDEDRIKTNPKIPISDLLV